MFDTFSPLEAGQNKSVVIFYKILSVAHTFTPSGLSSRLLTRFMYI